MHRLTHCPCCDADITQTIPVVIAPFIRERALAADTLDGALATCSNCGFQTYCDRYDEGEIAAIYSGYRDENYLKQRRRHEPWYTRAVNTKIGGLEEVARRTARLDAFLVRSGRVGPTASVLDWGGDRGQFMPTRFERRFVYDISGVKPVPGVVSLTSKQLSERAFDLVLLAHVLEHAPEPRALLEQVLAINAQYLYVEVPYEPLPVRPAHRSAAYARWVRGAARSRAYPLVACVSVALRVKFGMLPPFAVLQQHEHLNYFTEETLTRMLNAAGCHVVKTVAYPSPGAGKSVEAIAALVTIRPMTLRSPAL